MAKGKGKGPMKSVARGMNRANNALGQITAVLDQQSQALQQIQAGSQAVEDNQSDAKVLMSIKIQQAQLELQKDQAAFLKKISEGQNKQIEALQKGNKDWKSVGDKFKDLKRNLQDALDPDTIKKAMLGPFSMFKGVRNKMEDIDYAKRMKALGSTKSDKELRADSKTQRGYKETALRSQEDIDRLKKLGATDDQIAKSDAMKRRNTALGKFNELNVVNPSGKSAKDAANPMGGNVAAKSAPLAKTPSDKGMVAQSTTDLLAEQQVAKENQAEMLRLTAGQMDFLQQIATNTALMAGKRSSSAGGGEDAGAAGGGGNNGFSKAMGGIGNSMKTLGSGLGAIGQGIGQAIGGVFKGIMIGISEGIQAFASAKTLAGVAVLGLVTAVVYGLATSLKMFADIDWETMGKAAAAITGLIAAGAAAGAIAPLLGFGAAALLGLGSAVWVIGKGMEAMGNNVDNFISALDKLQSIDFLALKGVSDGLTMLGDAFSAFGKGQVWAGIGNLVNGLFAKITGQKTPIDQILDMGAAGPGIKDAAEGLGNMSGAMKEFAKVDSSSMKAIKEFPWEQATKFAAAGGAMSVAGAKVYNASKGNMDEQAKIDAKGNAPSVSSSTANIQQNNNQTNVVRPPVRNSESSYNKYLMSRF